MEVIEHETFWEDVVMVGKAYSVMDENLNYYGGWKHEED